MPEAYRIVVVDDHSVVRAGTRDILNAHPRFTVVGEADTMAALMAILDTSAPQAVLLDVNLPDGSSLNHLEALHKSYPALKIVLFSAFTDPPYVRRAQQANVAGYIAKTVEANVLQELLLQVLTSSAPGPVYSRDIAERLREAPMLSIPSLTAREQDIIALVAQGLTNQAVAKRLCIAVKTVDTHVGNLMKKTGAQNRTQLSQLASEYGWV